MFQELARIFENGTRVKLLKFFVFQSDQRFTVASAASTIGVSKAAAEKEVRALFRAGFLIKKKQKKNTLYLANPTHPSLPAIHAFLDVMTLPSDKAIAQAFRGIIGLSLIVATGALAREERAAVDLLIVGRKSQNQKVVRGVAKVERLAGLPLRYAFMEPERYTERLEAHDRILRDVFEFQHRVILGHP